MKRSTVRAKLQGEYARGRSDGHSVGYAAGLEAGRQEVYKASDAREFEIRARMVDAMAHGLKALADVAVPERV